MQQPTDLGTSSQPVRRNRFKKLSTINEEFDLALFSIIAQKKWKWLALIFLISIICAVLYLRYAQRIYEENTTIQIGSQNTASKVLQSPNGLYQNTEDELAEAIELMRSKLFLDRIFRALPMQVSYYTEGTFKDHEQYVNSPYTIDIDTVAQQELKDIKIYININTPSNGDISYTKDGIKYTQHYATEQWLDTHNGKIKVHINNYSEIDKFQNQVKKNPYFFVVNDYNKLASHYSTLITVRLLNPDAKTIQISCRDYDDRKASDIVNMMAQEYIKYDLDKRSKSAESVLNFIDEQLKAVYGQIKTTEGSLDTFKQDKKLNPDMELAKDNISHLFTIEDELTSANEEQKLITYLKKEIESKKDVDPSELIGILGGSGDYGASITENLSTLHHLITQKQQASYDITSNNSAMRQLNDQIASQNKIIQQSIDAIIARLNSKIQDLETQADKIKIQYFSSTSSANNIEYIRLQHLFSIDEKYYDDLLDKKTEYSLDKAGYVPQSLVLEKSIPNWIPVLPQKFGTFIVTILISISVGIVVLFIIYLFYNEITSVEEIERLAECPVSILGIVPEYTKEIPISQLIINNNPKSVLAESFRSIRTKLQFIRAGEKAKTISITSTISGEGKTFVSINLAGVIAYSGKKVIVLDLDMRRPRIHKALGLDNSKGMSTLLIGQDKLEDVVQKTITDNLFIITAGPIPPNPSELVISKEMDGLLVRLKQEYDIIIIDNPPVGLVTDGVTMLEKADYPIYVMRADYSKREFIHFIDRLYYENNFHNISIILNGVNMKKQAYSYGYYGYGYTYGQGSYYEE